MLVHSCAEKKIHRMKSEYRFKIDNSNYLTIPISMQISMFFDISTHDFIITHVEFKVTLKIGNLKNPR